MGSEVRHRTLLALRLVVLATAIAGCSRAVSGHAVTLDGRWQAKGYQCPAGVFHREVIDIVQHGTHVVATKVVGDKCVGSGHRTFQGIMTGTTGRVDCWLGSMGGTPAIAVRGAPLTLLMPNRFRLVFPGEAVIYTRTQAMTPTHSSNWWAWLLLAVLLIVVVLIAVIVRRIRHRKALHGDNDVHVP